MRGERIRRKIELHVALFLVLLSPGYNPPRRRRCLYLSRGKPPSRVRVSLPRPLPTLLALRSPRSTALSIHLLAAHSRPPPSNHPLRARSLALPFRTPPLRCTTAVPRHTLFSLSLSPRSQSHPPTHPTLLSTLYPCSTVPAHWLPLPSSPPSTSIRRFDSPQRQPPAEGGCALLAPESSRPRPLRGRGDGAGRTERRAGG